MSANDTRSRYKQALKDIAEGCPSPERIADKALNPWDTRVKHPPVLPGQWYGRLQVVYDMGCIHITENGREGVLARPDKMWLCWCECGKFTLCRSHNLRKLKKQSCGCFRVEITGARNRDLQKAQERWRHKRNAALDKLRTAARNRAKRDTLAAAKAALEATKRRLIPYAGREDTQPDGGKRDRAAHRLAARSASEFNWAREFRNV